MSENILVSVAWPYANADIHVGNIVGAYLPADIFARYHRLAGDNVLMVSGSDAHGTPITVRDSGISITCRRSRPISRAVSRLVPQWAQVTGTCGTTVSGSSTKQSVTPGCPGWPPLFLLLRLRKLRG
jgi:hypothetical protein